MHCSPRAAERCACPAGPLPLPCLFCRYGQGPWTLFKANMARQTKLFLRNRAFIGIRM